MDLISKKDLLACTGISYGQLYRWKRERLLPEEWFIKQSSFTGQETFFPRDQVLGRVKAILELKDDHSLEELVHLLASDPDAPVSSDKVRHLSGIDGSFADLLESTLMKGEYTIREIALVYALQQIAREADIAESVLHSLIRSAMPAMQGHRAHETLCTVLRSHGNHHVCFTTGLTKPTFDADIEPCGTVSIGEIAGMLRVRLESGYKTKITEEK